MSVFAAFILVQYQVRVYTYSYLSSCWLIVNSVLVSPPPLLASLGVLLRILDFFDFFASYTPTLVSVFASFIRVCIRVHI